ncbi:SubName: Full=Uncharacterized protein {ECO:0000313/EMBL:CCA75286.1} [Serendipita indica DSM 11827]|nr:SubName: Full=Uncharacterized protein {ECO:0000313/EMBL:CCA75286.1} [Serendipita indica DSM 11827]
MANTQNDAHQGSDEPHHPCISPPETPYPNGILFRQVSVIDGEETEGATRLRADVLINDGVISAIHRHEAAETSPEADLCDTDIYGDEEILKVDASGLVLCPHVATSSTSISTTVLRQGLRHITFPVLEYNQPYAPHHTDSSAFNYDSPLTLKDYQWPSSLTALCLDVLPENNTDLRSPLGNISSLVVRKMVYISGDEVLNIGLGLNLRHFDCRWHFYDGEADGQAKTLTSIRNFITMLSSLESLAIGIEYSKRDKYKSFRMTPHILEEYIGIIKKLRRLHAIKIYTFQLRADDSNPTFEKSVILRLAGACPTLEQALPSFGNGVYARS